MADLLGLSARIIDEGITDEPVNRVTQELSEITDSLAVVESFSHVITLRTAEGLVCFDTSSYRTGPAVVEAIRTWSTEPFRTLVYTHGHVDHVGGSGVFLADARRRGGERPTVVGHEAVLDRMDRYELTNGYNVTVNARQFGGSRGGAALGLGRSDRFLPDDAARPDTIVGDHRHLELAGTTIELRHARGETDDHLWAWLPQHRAICSGDFLIWNFPNAGNPQKVQRYPLEWAAALRNMIAVEPELLLPAHGLPIAGRERIAGVLDDVATALEKLVSDTLWLMNEGEPLDRIVHTVRVDPDLLAKPYLRPLYDEPEFVVRNIWRLYGGWYDGNPSRLKPAADSAFASEMAALTGGVGPLIDRARALSEKGDHRLACQVIELAVQAAPEDREAHGARAEIYDDRRRTETSLMAKGLYGWAARQSREVAGDG